MIISETELKHSLEYYLSLVSHQDIIIMRDGKAIAKLVDAQKDKSQIVCSLRGILPSHVDFDEIKEQKCEDI